MRPITEALGCLLPVCDHRGFRFERIVAVEDAGERCVAHISASGATYAAGEQDGRYILTHNIAKV